MITIIDYGLGNIQAFANIYKQFDIPYRIARNADELLNTSHLILPGVGAFDWAMQRLEASGMRLGLDNLVLNDHVPVLGICVGMQIMANSSEEGRLAGLGWIQGEVKRFDSRLFSTKTKLPHMGWNDVRFKDHPLFTGISNSRFYFLHSYFFSPESPDHILAETEYGKLFPASVGNKNIFGVQFHPEKSHHWGEDLLKNFAQL
jgi:imidazole glycerol-phosphate synthase subunit HisH